VNASASGAGEGTRVGAPVIWPVAPTTYMLAP
jgi:hypothetical protein